MRNENLAERVLRSLADFGYNPTGAMVTALLISLYGLARGDTQFAAIGATLWVFGYAYGTAGFSFVASRRWPPVDHRLAAAILVWGSLPWLLYLPYRAELSRPAVASWAGLAAMAVGAAAMILHRRPWPLRRSALRTAFVRASGLVLAAWVVGYLYLFDAGLWDGDNVYAYLLVFALLPVPFGAAWGAIKLLTSPAQPRPNPRAAPPDDPAATPLSAASP